MRSDRGLQTRISLANWLESVHFSTSELCLGSNYSPPCDKIDKFSVDRRAFVGTRPRLFVNGKTAVSFSPRVMKVSLRLVIGKAKPSSVDL